MATKLHTSIRKQRAQVKLGFAKLTNEWETWCANNKLPCADALELYMSNLPNKIQCDYILEFCERWEMLDKLDLRLMKIENELEGIS